MNNFKKVFLCDYKFISNFKQEFFLSKFCLILLHFHHINFLQLYFDYFGNLKVLIDERKIKFSFYCIPQFKANINEIFKTFRERFTDLGKLNFPMLVPFYAI